MKTRKKSSLFILIFVISIFISLPILFFLNHFLIESNAFAGFIAWFFQNVYFSILPGLFALGICLFYYDTIEKNSKEVGIGDYFWIGIWIVCLLLFFIAYTSRADSIFKSLDPFLPFLVSSGRYSQKMGPALDVFVLSNSMIVLMLATIFLFPIMERFHIDRKKAGALFINIIIALLFSIFVRTDYIHTVEENMISIMYSTLRNPGKKEIPDVMFAGKPLNYCTTPQRKQYIQDRIKFNNDVVRIAHQRGKAELITDQFPRIPVPAGIRDDIEIIGVTTEDIEAVNFQWPLDWEIYANISSNFGGYKDSILVYDINFMDIKGISGGNKCNDPDGGFKCTAYPGQTLINQTNILSDKIKYNRNKVLADYPIYVSTEQRDILTNYQQRLSILQQKTGIKNIKNGKYAIVRASLPVPPIVPVSKHLDMMGHANVFIDDATHQNRKVPLVIRVVNYEKRGEPDYDPNIHDSYYPGIALATVLSYFDVDPSRDVEVDYLAGYLKINNIPKKTFDKVDFEKGGIVKIDIMKSPNEQRSIKIPMDRSGLMDINFRGGLYCFPYKPILEVAYEWNRREKLRIERLEAERKRIKTMDPRDFAAYVGSTLPHLVSYRHELIRNLDSRFGAATRAEKEKLPYYESLFRRIRSAQKINQRLAIAKEIKQKDPDLYAWLVKDKYQLYTPAEKGDLSLSDKSNLQNRYEKKIALVAMYYATGVDTAKDVHLAPYGTMSGIEHQAYAINTILNQDFAKNSSPLVDLLLLLIIAIMIGTFQPRVGTIMSFVLSGLIALAYAAFTVYFSFGVYSYIHIFPTVIIEQIVILISFIGFRIFAEEENVKYIRNTFSKFVSQDVVDELLTNPEALGLGGAKKEISVFFSDVRGFTTISEKLGPEELVQLLNEYLSVMTDLIIEYKGTIDKYMGDAIMAFWGAPVENDDHAYYTCVSAIAQYIALKKLQVMWEERGVPAIDIGIGINTGHAVVGNMGSSARMDYTLMGDTVNLGARLEGITKQYGVKMVISEYTYERVKDRIYARELDLVRVKGKLEPVRIYELMGLVNDNDLETLKITKKEP